MVLPEDHEDLVAEIREALEEHLHRRALTVTAARLAVVDEILAEQAIHGAQVTLVDRLRVETTDKLPVLRLALHGASLTVVRRESCLVPYVHNVEVTGSHVGLAFNRKVYRVLADALHAPERVPVVQ